MKKSVFYVLIIMCLTKTDIYAQCGNTSASNFNPASIGIVIYSNDVETVWNALRFANYSVNAGDTVKIFLLGKGVELDTMVNQNPNIKEETENFLKNKGSIFGCGTCLQSRNNFTPHMCKMSSMSDLYEIIRKSKTVLTF